MNYKIAIPSYNRPQGLLKKTLKYLNSKNIPHDKIYIFVNNQNQFNFYRIYIPEDINIVITNQNGLVSSRNFIEEYFNLNDFIICMDDDISLIKQLYIAPDG